MSAAPSAPSPAALSEAAIRRLLRPQSLALVGGGWTDAVAAGNRVIGYGGQIWRVNPKRESTADCHYYASVDDLPGSPDQAFIAVPARDAIGVAAALERRKAGGFVCFASGFSELGTAAGQALTDALIKAAPSVPFFGPNCYGIANFFDRCALLPDQVVGAPLDRGVALICQSGTIGLTLTFNGRSVPIGYLFTVGNQTRLAVEDLLVEAREEMRFKASHDALTTLWNRAVILELLERELSCSHRENATTVIILCDIDHFKNVNDTLGHLIGDKVLRETTKRLLASVRSYDFVGRYGGEEFLVVLNNCDPAFALARAEEIRNTIAQRPVQTVAGAVSITVSLGLLLSHEWGVRSVAQLLHETDTALYAAKAAGRNCVRLASPTTVLGASRSTVKEPALKGDRFARNIGREAPPLPKN
jgi:diguanylate cyclase (GGDEF)-like protein